MIHAVRFRSFKALRDVELELDRFTVLVGPSASGKTSVLQGLHLLSRLASTDPRVVFEGKSALGVVASRGAEGVFELALSGTFRRKRGDLSIAFSAIEDFPFTDTYRFESRWGDRRFAVRRALATEDEALDAPGHEGGHPPAPGGELGLGLVLREASFVSFDVDLLAEPSYSDDPTPTIGPRGEGLAAVLADMAVSRPDDFARLQDAVRAILPGLLRVRLARARVPRAPGSADDAVWGHEIVFDMAGANDVPARAASEGMLVVLGLFATLLGPDRRELVLVDRLERAVAPGSLPELVARLNEVLALDPDLQIVATSDSPLLLDQVAVEAVRVHCLLEDGSARIKPLRAHPEHDLLSGDLRPGEFWVQVGDAWVAEEPEQPPDEAPAPPPETEAPGLELHAFPASMPPLPSGPARQ